jgi:flavodoxin
MNAVVYASRGGNTKKLAEAIAKGAGASAQSAGDAADLPQIDILFVGASIYAGKIDGSMRRFLQGLDVARVNLAVVFGTAAGDKSALSEVQSILAPKGVPISKDAFQCRGSFLLANRGRPNDDDLRKAEDFARRIAGGTTGD